MPKIVDRAERRAAIVEAYLTVVARDGARGATSRAVAAELGVATGSLWHYFADIDELLLAAFERVYAQSTARILERIHGIRGLDAVEAALREMLPLDPYTQNEATIVVAFWGRVASEPELGAIHNEVEENWRGILARHVAEAIADGELAPGAPAADIVDTLLALTAAQQIEHVVHTAIGAPSRQWSLVQHALAPWRA